MWTYGPKYRVFRTEHTEYVDIWSYRLDIQTMHYRQTLRFQIEKRNDDITFLKLWDAIG